ncbi:MAG: YebO family protein [Candidatus Bathyarchaeota archaeon]|nr:YebO family protein [Candidatus Bathyarchaeota archaeon]
MKKSILPQFAIFLTLLLVGLSFYQGTFSHYNVTSHTTTGVVLSQNPYDPNEISSTRFEMAIDTTRNTIRIEFDFVYWTAGNYSFALSLPYQISKLETWADSGMWTYDNGKSGSIVIASLNVTHNPETWSSARLYALIYTQTIANTVFETCSVSIPFGGGFTYDVQTARDKIAGAMTTVGDGYPGKLFITIPSNCILSTSTLPVMRIDSGAGQQVLQFDIEEFSPFQMQYIDPDARRIFERNLLFSGVFIGAAVSVLAGIIIKNLKIKDSKKPNTPDSSHKTDAKRNNEREFQLQMFEAQRDYGTVNSILTVIIAVSFSLTTTVIAISYTNISQELRIFLAYMILPILAITAGTTMWLVLYHKVWLPNKALAKLRKTYVDNYSISENEEIILLKQILEEQKKVNETLMKENKQNSKETPQPDKVGTHQTEPSKP